jgi:hypothetical protein
LLALFRAEAKLRVLIRWPADVQVDADGVLLFALRSQPITVDRLLNAGVLTTPTGRFILSTPMNEGVVDRMSEAVDAALHDLTRPGRAQA